MRANTLWISRAKTYNGSSAVRMHSIKLTAILMPNPVYDEGKIQDFQ